MQASSLNNSQKKERMRKMLKKRLASLFMSITIAATTMLAAVPTASAYYKPTSFDVELVSAGSTWGNVKKKTVNAVPAIIEYCLAHGYNLDVITTKTPLVQLKIAN